MEKDTFGAFEALVGELNGPTFNNEDAEDKFPMTDPSEIDDNEDPDEKEPKETKTSNKEEKENNNEEKDEIDEKEELDETLDDKELVDTKSKEETKDTNETLDLGEFESDITKYVQEKLYEKLGWESEEDDKFENVEDLVSYLEKIVETNSTPNFANDEVSKLNEYVQNGGDLKTYFSNLYGEFDINTIDIKKEPHQELVVREQLKELGLSKEAIDKRIQRYSDTGILEEEAGEAYDYLKNNIDKKQEKLLEDQKRFKEELQNQQQKMYEDVSSTINDLKDIHGITINNTDKKKLIDYIFKPGSDGKTQYQKDYSKSFNNLIESAFYTMKGDTIFKSLKRQSESQAVKTLKDKLQTKTKLGKDSGEANKSYSQDDSILNSFSRLLKP
jgi:hypothetical protein